MQKGRCIQVKKDEVVKQFTTPLDAGAFPLGPYRFYHREYLNIVYKTDLEKLKKSFRSLWR